MPGDPNLRRTAHWRSEYQFHDARTWASTGGLADEHIPSQKVEFDRATRLKGMSVLCSGILISGYFLREFLVWSAGHQFAWYRPSNKSGLFWVRRFKDEWDDVAKKDREPDKVRKEQEKVRAYLKKVKAEKERDADDFYKKRHVSNVVKRKNSPRGHAEASS